MEPVRKWYVARALQSYVSLNEVIGELTMNEVLACLATEAASTRRKSITDRLLSRAVRLNEIEFVATLKTRYDLP